MKKNFIHIQENTLFLYKLNSQGHSRTTLVCWRQRSVYCQIMNLYLKYEIIFCITKDIWISDLGTLFIYHDFQSCPDNITHNTKKKTSLQKLAPLDCKIILYLGYVQRHSLYITNKQHITAKSISMEQWLSHISRPFYGIISK